MLKQIFTESVINIDIHEVWYCDKARGTTLFGWDCDGLWEEMILSWALKKICGSYLDKDGMEIGNLRLKK